MTILALLLVSTFGPAATAADAPPKGSWLVLIRSGDDVPETWAAELQRAAERAAQENDDVTIIPPPQVSLTDIQLAVGCLRWGPKCAGKVASMMSADLTLTLTVERKRKGGDATLSWSIVNGRGKVLRKGAPKVLPGLNNAGLDTARSTLRSIIIGVPPTVLIIESDLPGAEVFIDGRRVGETPYTAHDISPGGHKIRLQLEGRAPLTAEVNLEAGQTLRRAFVLSSAGPPAHNPKVGESAPVPLSISPILAFAVLGSGVGITAFSGAFYAAHVVLGLLYAKRPMETQVAYFARTDGLPARELAAPASIGSYGAFIVVLSAGVLIAASGAGLVLAAFLLPGESGEVAAASSATPGE